jgi:hypothetical protein
MPARNTLSEPFGEMSKAEANGTNFLEAFIRLSYSPTYARID